MPRRNNRKIKDIYRPLKIKDIEIYRKSILVRKPTINELRNDIRIGRPVILAEPVVIKVGCLK
jgi:hypothetical protein